MDLNKTLLKIQSLLKERNWTLYHLAKKSCIPYSSLNSLFQKNNQPTISTLEKICFGFGISMTEFFSDNPPYREYSNELSKDEQLLLSNFRNSRKRDRDILLSISNLFCLK